jgi:hypothetical protein
VDISGFVEWVGSSRIREWSSVVVVDCKTAKTLAKLGSRRLREK